MIDVVPPLKKIVSVNVPHALFSRMIFFTFEGGTDRLSLNIGAELPFFAA